MGSSSNFVSQSVDLSAFAARLKRARAEVGLTQFEFAEWGNVGVSSQQQYEAGKTAPTIEYLMRLTAQGIDAMYLLTGRMTNSDPSDRARQVTEIFDGLQSREQDAVMAMMQVLAGVPVEGSETKPPSDDEKKRSLHEDQRTFRSRTTD